MRTAKENYCDEIKYVNKEAVLVILESYSTSTVNFNTATYAYGITGTAQINITFKYGISSGIQVLQELRFDSLCICQYTSNAATTNCTQVGGVVNLYHMFSQDYYNDYYVSNPVSGITYTKYLNSQYFEFQSNSLELSALLYFSNGQSSSYTRTFFINQG